jgi:hypothetical protein
MVTAVKMVERSVMRFLVDAVDAVDAAFDGHQSNLWECRVRCLRQLVTNLLFGGGDLPTDMQRGGF